MYFVPFVDTSPLPPFTAVLLAGGKSTRMGRDKAGVLIDGHPLWQYQLATLRAIHPHELFISGKPDGPYAGAGVEILGDNFPGLGPLAGLEAALRRANCPLMLVLAIDLPAMTAEFLSELLRASAASGTGLVPCVDDRFEPLAAVYPRACLPLVGEHLHAADRSMRRFVQACLAREFVRGRAIADVERHLFRNLNTPEDLSAPRS